MCIFVLAFIFRVLYLICKIKNGSSKYIKEKRTDPAKTIICIGSGGHTTEMVKLIQHLNPQRYFPRFYVMAQNDVVSEEKIEMHEKKSYENKSEYTIVKIPRSRVVNQSYISSVFTTLKSILYSIPIMFKIKPDLILCNGPGTCVPICLISFLMKVLFICNTRIVFIESICRVESFSLTGKILMYFADNVVVQWEELTKVCKRADYLGQLF